MEVKLFWKSVIRRKGSLLLLLALISVSTFGFVLRVAEYLAVNREITRISEEYRPIGSLSAPDGVVTEGVSLVMESQYVERADINRHCPAVLSDIYNADIEGILNMYQDQGIDTRERMVWGTVIFVSETEEPNVRIYQMRIEEGVYGYPDYIKPGTFLRMKVVFTEDEPAPMPVMETGKTYLVKGCPYEEDNLRGETGEFVNVRLLPLDEGLWFLEGEPDDETARKYLGENFALQERNRHAMMATSTKDMTALPLVQETSRDFYLEDGRWITKQDQENGNRVCVVSKEFADVRGLSVGDLLTMTFQDRMVYLMGYSGVGEDTWESCEKTEETLEIVGIYGRRYGGLADGPGWAYLSYLSNEIYVPDICIPEQYVQEGEIWQDSFSFMLGDARKKDLFQEEVGEKLKSLGMDLVFVENNWDSFYPTARSMEQGSFYSLAVFGAVLVLTLAAVVFLYIWQRRRECAIARAMGVPAKRAAVCACLPLMLLGIPGILVGGGLAWTLGREKSEEILATLEYGEKAVLSLGWFWGILFLVWLLFSLGLLVVSLFWCKKPVLEVLRSGNAVPGKKAAPAGAADGMEYAHGLKTEATKGEKAFTGTGETEVPPLSPEIAGDRISLRVLVRFARRHLSRFSLRTLFSMLVAMGFFIASCWLWNAIQSGEREIERLYGSTVVEAEITKKNEMTFTTANGGAFISSRTWQEFLDTEFVQNATLIGGSCGGIYKIDETEVTSVDFIGIADGDESLSRLGVEIRYGDGFGSDVFSLDYSIIGQNMANFPVIFLPEQMAAELGVDPGEVLMVSDRIGFQSVSAKVGGVYAASGEMESTVLIPLPVLGALVGDDLYYSVAEFSLNQEKNREIEEFRHKGEKIVEEAVTGELPLALVVWDGELKRVVEPMEKNITLMKILYPLANAVSFLAAFGLSILFLFQRRREAAVLRILGVGIIHTRMVLILELLTADLTGLLLSGGVAVLLIGAGGLEAFLTAAGCYFAGCLLGTMAGAVLVTQGKPLELLQEKE